MRFYCKVAKRRRGRHSYDLRSITLDRHICRSAEAGSCGSYEATPTDTDISFGPYRFIPSQRLLTRDGQSVHVGSRAFDILAALVEAGGELVTTRALTDRVWPNGFVDESALRVHIATLRKILGEGTNGKRFIVNEAGRGYRLVGTLEQLPAAATAGPAIAMALPRPLGRVVGRDDVITRLCEQVAVSRLVTIVGPGGMGKTTVAVAVAERLADRFDHEALFVDFASVAETANVTVTLAALLDVVVAEKDGLGTILHVLAERKQLLIFDNCEHLVDAVSVLAEAVLRHAPGVHILATSQEALRADGEWVHRLLPLTFPKEDETVDNAAAAMGFTAVQLFVERIEALAGGYRLTDEDAPFAAAIAHRLDGIPLALELAAARVEMFGLRTLDGKLDDRFSILTQGRRTAIARHQTLRATVDWSYDLLTPQDQSLLRELSAFRGKFLLGDAVALRQAPGASVFAGLSNLVGKSLVALEAGQADVAYRLLDTIEAYAREKLYASEALAAVSRRHAEFGLSIAKKAAAAILDGRFASDRDDFTRYLDDLRAALNWALSPGGDIALGAEIAATAGSLWFQLTLLTEYRRMTERALAAIAGTELEATATGMQLLAASGQAIWHTEGPSTAMLDAFTRTLDLAERSRSTPYLERAHWGLWNANTLRGNYRAGFAHAEQLEALWPNGEHAIVVDRLKARSLNFLGHQEEARRRARRVLDHALTHGTAPAHGLAFLEPVVARTVIARAQWSLGFPDRALAEAETCIAEMRASGHALSLCYALAVAGVPVALWTGAEDLARSRAEELRAEAERHGLIFWRSWSNVYDLALSWRDNPAPERLQGLGFMELEHLCTWGVEEAVPFLESRVDAGEGGWCLPEVLRLQAEALHASGQIEAATARIIRARSEAETLGGRSWLLRIAMTEASFMLDTGNVAAVQDELEQVYLGFTEGFATVDLMRAAAMLVAVKGKARNNAR